MQTNDKMFETATRNKIRFPSSRGELSVEQLWDLSPLSKDGFNLDTIAKGINKTLKEMTEESFVITGRTPAHAKLELQLELVKYIIGVKLAEEALAKMRAENRVEREKLLRILAEKQDGHLSELSEKELQQRINALES